MYDTADAEFKDALAVAYEEGADIEYDALDDPDYTDVVQLEYELEVADLDYGEMPQATRVVEPESVVAIAAKSDFTFETGRAVLPLTQPPHPVVWRSHLKERHPATGLLHRVPVYRLANGYWDCYWKEELQVA